MNVPILPDSKGVPRGPVVIRPTPSKAVPFDRWPVSFRYYAKRAQRGDVGLGDVFERDFGTFGRLFKRFYKLATGHDCGCQERREWLNARFPLALTGG
jgi:hypothetical protein